jgi:hypothetical protein
MFVLPAAAALCIPSRLVQLLLRGFYRIFLLTIVFGEGFENAFGTSKSKFIVI